MVSNLPANAATISEHFYAPPYYGGLVSQVARQSCPSLVPLADVIRRRCHDELNGLRRDFSQKGQTVSSEEHHVCIGLVMICYPHSRPPKPKHLR